MNPAAAAFVTLLVGTTAFAAFRSPDRESPVPDPSLGPVPAGFPEPAPEFEAGTSPWTGPTLRGSPIPPRAISSVAAAVESDEPTEPKLVPAAREIPVVEIVDAETGLPLACSGWWSREHEQDVRPPPGYLTWDQTPPLEPRSRYRTRLVATYPLRREANVEATVREWNDTLALDAGLEEARIGGRSVPHAEIEPYVSGTYRIRGIPFLAGEALSLTFVPGEQTEGYAHRSVAWKGDLPPAWGDVLRPEVTLPFPQALGVAITSVRRRGCCGGCRGCCVFVETFASDGEPQGQVEITVRRRGGAPASCADVAVQALFGGEWIPVVDFGTSDGPSGLDENGRLRVAHLAPDRYRVRVRESGIVPVEREFDVVDGRTTEVEIVEPEGATLDVQVVDPEGRPRKFARVEVRQASDVTWADLADDGTERLDRFVDHLGRRTLAHVEPGEVRIRATWAGRTFEKTVTVVDGETARVRIEVP